MTTLTLVFNAVMAINQQTLSDQTSIGINYFMLKIYIYQITISENMK